MKEEDESKWVADAPHSGLILVSEGDPPPGAHMGHMSFSSFNPELQKLQVGTCFLHPTLPYAACVPSPPLPPSSAALPQTVYKRVSSSDNTACFMSGMYMQLSNPLLFE